MEPELLENDSALELEQDVVEEQHEVSTIANKTLPTTQEARVELQEAVSEAREGNEEETPAAAEEAPAEEAPAEETVAADQRQAQADGAPIPEIEISTNEKISQMRKTNFAQAVAKGSQLEDVSQKSKMKQGMNTVTGFVSKKSGAIGAVAGVGLAAKSAYDIKQTVTDGKKVDAPDGKGKHAEDIIMSWGTSLLLSVLSILKVYTIFKSNDSASAKILKSIPNLLGVLCNIAESCIVSAAKYTQKTRNVLNFLAPAKTFLKILDCVGDHAGVMQRRKSLESMKNKGTLDEVKMKPVIDKLSRTAIEFIPNILSLGAKNVAELGYAIAYAKDPVSTTTFGFKIASQAASGTQGLVSAALSHATDGINDPDKSHRDLSDNLYTDFTTLYTNGDVYLGAENEPAMPDTLDKKQAALQVYENAHDELEASGVSFYELSHAADREEQQKIITKAVGY